MADAAKDDGLTTPERLRAADAAITGTILDRTRFSTMKMTMTEQARPASETPRTQQVILELMKKSDHEMDYELLIRLACTLERENAALAARLKEAESHGAYEQQRAGVAVDELKTLHNLSSDILEYLEDREDVNADGTGPNRAMSLATALREAMGEKR